MYIFSTPRADESDFVPSTQVYLFEGISSATLGHRRLFPGHFVLPSSAGLACMLGNDYAPRRSTERHTWSTLLTGGGGGHTQPRSNIFEGVPVHLCPPSRPPRRRQPWFGVCPRLFSFTPATPLARFPFILSGVPLSKIGIVQVYCPLNDGATWSTHVEAFADPHPPPGCAALMIRLRLTLTFTAERVRRSTSWESPNISSSARQDCTRR